MSVLTELPHRWLKEPNTVCATIPRAGRISIATFDSSPAYLAQSPATGGATSPALHPYRTLRYQSLSCPILPMRWLLSRCLKISATVPPGPAASSSAPNVLTYSYASRMVYVAPGETYDVRPLSIQYRFACLRANILLMDIVQTH